ncbi:hypothetical protein L3V82_05065 [Thiotrichales bacterium 19S3-7]|nr:hypothetical protein [Thiotrichales bacterium 19S3-7]MCF6801463.1 hypothetical protein [Thiotrichales bacterium 19S3-11]
MNFDEILKRVERNNIKSITTDTINQLCQRYEEKKNENHLLFSQGSNDDALIQGLQDFANKKQHTSKDLTSTLIQKLAKCDRNTWLADCIIKLLNKALNVEIATEKLITGHHGGTVTQKYPSEMAKEYNSKLFEKTNPALIAFAKYDEDNNDKYYDNNGIFAL